MRYPTNPLPDPVRPFENTLYAMILRTFAGKESGDAD